MTRHRMYRVRLARELEVELLAASPTQAAELALARANSAELHRAFVVRAVEPYAPTSPRRRQLTPEACPGSYSQPVSVGSGGYGAGKCGTCGQHANLLKDGALTRHKRREVK